MKYGMDEIKIYVKISAEEILTPWKFLVKALWKSELIMEIMTNFTAAT